MYTTAHSICPYTCDALLRHGAGRVGWTVCVGGLGGLGEGYSRRSCRFSSAVILKPLPGLFMYTYYIIYIRLLTASVMKKKK